MGEHIPDWLFNVIAGRFKGFVSECLRNGGQPDFPLLLEYAIHAARADVEHICDQLQGGNARYNACDIRDVIAAQVYAKMRQTEPMGDIPAVGLP